MKTGGMIPCYCYLRNVQDLLSDRKIQLERRLREPFCGPTVPFGSMIEYQPISANDKRRLHQFVFFSKKRSFQASPLALCCMPRESGKEISLWQPWRSWKFWRDLMPKSGEKFIFRVADGTVKLAGENRYSENQP